MNRAQAIDKVRKLRTLADPSRGATPAERATAARMAERIAIRFGLSAGDTEPRIQRGPQPGQRVWSAPATGAWGFTWPEYTFNPVTGAASANVEVHYHHGAGNWRITIHDERIGRKPITGETIRQLKGSADETS